MQHQGTEQGIFEDEVLLPSSPMHQETEARPEVTKEQIAQYFSNIDPPQMASSLITDHLEKVEIALAGEIHNERTQVVDLRSSLFSLQT